MAEFDLNLMDQNLVENDPLKVIQEEDIPMDLPDKIVDNESFGAPPEQEMQVDQ